MNVYCPSCKGYRLEPKELEPGLIAGGCSKCHGNLIPLMNYRYWQENLSAQLEPVTISIDTQDSSQAKICPKCSRLMSKFNIGNDTHNRLDMCISCDEAWLDAGEWELLKQLGLHDKLARIFTEEWQRDLRQQQKREAVRGRYRALLGENDFDRVDQFKQWLDSHENRESIKQYLILKFDA